jgi:phosphoribosylanthranilate isomerase
MTKIKICGITNLEDALLSVELGVDALGFIFSNGPRKISLEEAKKIIDALPPFVIKVGVFCNEPIEVVRDFSQFLNLDLIQFHGDEPPEYVLAFKGKGVKAFRVSDYKVLEKIKEYRSNFFILDSEKKGEPFDWDIAIRAKEIGQFLLGGGLNPENIESALKKVSPFGVDVCSGVESKPGKKDPLKLKEFIWRIKRWES